MTSGQLIPIRVRAATLCADWNVSAITAPLFTLFKDEWVVFICDCPREPGFCKVLCRFGVLKMLKTNF